METPYVILNQPDIPPIVLQELIDTCWDKLDDNEKQEIIRLLKRKNVKYD